MENTTQTKALTLLVSFNDETLLKHNKKSIKLISVLFILSAVFFASFFILSTFVSNNPSIFVSAFWGIATILCILAPFFYARTTKYNSKNDNLFYKYTFYADGMEIAKNSRRTPDTYKSEIICLYREFPNKQYVSKVIEHLDCFEFKIYTGTYNFVPQYKIYNLPKSAFKDSTMVNTFITSLKNLFKNDYKQSY